MHYDQPLPFHPGASFGAIPMGTLQAGSGSSGGTLGSTFAPRNIDIRIRTGAKSYLKFCAEYADLDYFQPL